MSRVGISDDGQILPKLWHLGARGGRLRASTACKNRRTAIASIRNRYAGANETAHAPFCDAGVLPATWLQLVGRELVPSMMAGFWSRLSTHGVFGIIPRAWCCGLIYQRFPGTTAAVQTRLRALRGRHWSASCFFAATLQPSTDPNQAAK